MANYQTAKERLGDVSSPDVTLTEDDVEFFVKQWRHSASLELLLPAFGHELEGDVMDLSRHSFSKVLSIVTRLQRYRERTIGHGLLRISHVGARWFFFCIFVLLGSYPALIAAQINLLKRAILACDFVAGEGDQVARLVDLFKKLHILDFKCGEPRGEAYNEMIEILRSMFESLMEECSRCVCVCVCVCVRERERERV